jgi:hypothetical protein
LPEECQLLLSIELLIFLPFGGVLAFDADYVTFTPIWRREELHCCSYRPDGTGLSFSSEMLAKVAPDGINFLIIISVLNY